MPAGRTSEQPVSAQRPWICGWVPVRRDEKRRRRARSTCDHGAVSFGERSGANASFVTSPAHTRSHSAFCRSSDGTPWISASRSVKKQAPAASRSRIATCAGSAGDLARAAARGRAEHRGVLAEVERHPAGAPPERARADPHDLAGRAQLVHPRGRVGADAARQHVALPHLGREREALQRHERLAQAVDAGAAGRMAVDALPAREEARERALVGRLDLLAQRGQRGAPQAPQHLGVAPLARGTAGAQLAAHELAGALEPGAAPA